MAQKVTFGIAQKLLLILLLVAVVPLLIIWFVSYQNISSLTGEKVNLELTAINETLTAQVNDWVDMNLRMLTQNALLEAMTSMDAGRQNVVLKSIVANYDWSYLAFTTDVDGNNIGRSDGKPNKYYGDREYFKQVVEGDGFGRQILIGKTSGKPAMVLSTGILDNTGKLQGVLAQAMTLEKLSSEIVAAKIGESGFSFLVDEKDDVIAHLDAQMTKSRKNLGENMAVKAIRAGKKSIVYTDTSGKKVIAVGQKTSQGWTMISQQDYDEAFRGVKAQNQKALFLLIGTLVVVCIIAFLVSRSLTAPIRGLTVIAEKYSKGQLDLAISGLDRSDEIGQLSQAIERLGTSIRIAMNRLRKKK